ncbi:MAG: hypothetical protein K2O52_07025, partial [Oscillospiraceae bacterium]|nr:hypothetical protein [Oscillospiraceae bacterium]
MKKKILVSIFVALMLGIVQPMSTVVSGHNQFDTLTVENTPVEQGSEPDNSEYEDNDENSTFYAIAHDTVDITTNGEITLISDHAGENQVSTLSLSLNLKVRDDVEDNISINSVYFEFDEVLREQTKVVECEYDFCEDTTQLTLYVSGLMSGVASLFDNTGSLYLGRVIVDDISIENIEIPLPPLDMQERIVNVLDNF